MTIVLDKTQQALADITGILIDRTVIPEKIVGQAWIISKSRMVVLASSVANYADAPWALIVKFPYPDLSFSVKAIALHPDFNKRASRDNYLAQLNELHPSIITFDNDIATIILDQDLSEPSADKIQELNRALSLPLVISAQDLSGTMKAGDLGNILQKAIVSGRNGILSFFDERKVPFARVLIRQGKVLKAAFHHLTNENAICELMWRKPAGNYVMQQQENISWGKIADISMPTNDLANEAIRRNQELPRMIDALGGPNVRYSRLRDNFDLNQINPNVRWIVERVWTVLDGYLPLSKLSERVLTDTSTALQAVWEMKHLGLVGISNNPVFHCSHQLGNPCNPAHDLDINAWDHLTSFYLDDLSFAPVNSQGNYFGSSHLLSTKSLLHTIQIPSAKYGAAIFKDGRLVGIYSGAYAESSASQQDKLPMQLSKMTWVGSLSDMSAKRMRNTAPIDLSELAESEGASSSSSKMLSSSKSSMTTNANYAGTEIPPSEQIPKSKDASEPEILRRFSKIQILSTGAAMFVIGLLLSLNSLMSGPKTVVATNSSNQKGSATGATTNSTLSSTKNETTGSETSKSKEEILKVIKPALALANFKEIPIPPYIYTDTSADTAPKPSFGMESESANQQILFVLYPNNILKKVVDSCSGVLPFWNYVENKDEKAVEEISTEKMAFRVHSYWTKENKQLTCLVAAFPSSKLDSSILVLARPYKAEGTLDYRSITNMIDRMFIESSSTPSAEKNISEEENKSSDSSSFASREELDLYRQKLLELVKSSYKAPPDAERANQAVVKFAVDANGQIAKMELKYSSGLDEVDKSFQRAISSNSPLPIPPKTKEPYVAVQITNDKGEFTVQEP